MRKARTNRRAAGNTGYLYEKQGARRGRFLHAPGTGLCRKRRHVAGIAGQKTVIYDMIKNSMANRRQVLYNLKRSNS